MEHTLVILISVFHYASIRAITEQISFLRKAKGIHVGLSLRENKIQKGHIAEAKYLNFTAKYDCMKKSSIRYVFLHIKKKIP